MKKFFLFLMATFFQICTAQIEFGPYQNHGFEPYSANMQGVGTIYYTTDGTVPNSTSPSGQNTVSVTITENVVINARLKNSSNQWSEVFSRPYYFGELPQHNLYFKPPPTWTLVCSYMNFIQPQFMVDFWGPGNQMTPVCEGWKKSTFGFYIAAVSFNNCIPWLGELFQEINITADDTVFYDYSLGPITNPPACLLAVNDPSVKVAMIKVFPNPVQDLVTIDSDKTFVAYEILDASGKSLMRKELHGKQIDVSSLTSGVYFIKLKSADTHTTLIKFIKK